MERYFKMEDGSLCNVIEHCVEQIGMHPDLKIYIATDSQVHKKVTTFATVIVFRYGRKGAHYIFNIEKVGKNKYSHYERLFQEGVYTINTAEMITKSGSPISIERLEFDYAGVKKTLSSPLISAVKGWALGLGYNPIFKGGEMIATKAGDHICRKFSQMV